MTFVKHHVAMSKFKINDLFCTDDIFTLPPPVYENADSITLSLELRIKSVILL